MYLYMQAASSISVLSNLQGMQGPPLTDESCLAGVIGAPGNMPDSLLALYRRYWLQSPCSDMHHSIRLSVHQNCTGATNASQQKSQSWSLY